MNVCTYTYHEENGTIWTRSQVVTTLQTHGIPYEEREAFFAEHAPETYLAYPVGASYEGWKAVDVLRWLGY